MRGERGGGVPGTPAAIPAAAGPTVAVPVRRLRRFGPVLAAAVVGFGVAGLAVALAQVLARGGSGSVRAGASTDPCRAFTAQQLGRLAGGRVLSVAPVPVAGETRPTLCAYTTDGALGLVTVALGHVGTPAYALARNEVVANPEGRPRALRGVGDEAYIGGNHEAFVARGDRYADITVQFATPAAAPVLEALARGAVARL